MCLFACLLRSLKWRLVVFLRNMAQIKGIYIYYLLVTLLAAMGEAAYILKGLNDAIQVI